MITSSTLPVAPTSSREEDRRLAATLYGIAAALLGQSSSDDPERDAQTGRAWIAAHADLFTAAEVTDPVYQHCLLHDPYESAVLALGAALRSLGAPVDEQPRSFGSSDPDGLTGGLVIPVGITLSALRVAVVLKEGHGPRGRVARCRDAAVMAEGWAVVKVAVEHVTADPSGIADDVWGVITRLPAMFPKPH
jgi:hypothetical protein